MRKIGLTLFFILGCAGDDISSHSCPTDGTSLTYGNFGEGFLARYCYDCHGGRDDHSSHSFTTIESIRSQRDRIFINAAGSNSAMPPGPDDPPQTERDKLAEWLVCGAP